MTISKLKSPLRSKVLGFKRKEYKNRGVKGLEVFSDKLQVSRFMCSLSPRLLQEKLEDGSASLVI